ncbi:hypothetical protein J4410_07025 [Candidatus Woesearchaeota archaeon]|nr:hypothetical protein [Candidatus Woesearchaeota archaeon]
MKTKPPRTERKKRTGWYITLFIAGVMVLSIFGIINNPDQAQSYTYQEYTFTYNQRDFQYDTKINDKTVKFTFLPQDVESLSLQDITQLKDTNSFLMTYDPTDLYAETLGSIQYLLETELYDHKNIIVQRGLVNATGYSLPEVTCATATPQNQVLLFRTANQTSFTHENFCFIIEGSTQTDLIQYFDRLRYALYGVIA